MNTTQIYRLLTYCIAAVWLINGLFCKVLNLVPRHQQIVAQILGVNHSRLLTILIGVAEIVMVAWNRFFWAIRLFIQFFGYSTKLWKGKPFETSVHLLFSLFWAYLSLIFLAIYFR
jgi:hypothetical protein